MNATKRKFNALLNGIGTKPTTSSPSKEVNNGFQTNPTSTTDSDTQAKKRRVSGSPAASATASSLLKDRLTTTMRHKKSASIATPATITEAPKYAPWDRAEFLNRLKSFSNLTDWTPKPARVNEVEWAKRGWVCQKFERVRCCLCNVEILVKLNKKEVDGKEVPVYIAENIENAMIDKYAELIVTSHNEDCLWRKRGCDDSIFKLPLNHAATTIKTLRDRYEELRSRSESLPYIFNIQTPPDFNLEIVLSHLPSSFFITSTGQAEHTDINKVAFLMALFGWEGHEHPRLGPQPGSVSCKACFRVLGLWMFKSKSVGEDGQEVTGAPVNSLDIVKVHRGYCPWANAASQNGQNPTVITSTSALSGWEIVLRTLKNDHLLRIRDQTGVTPPQSRDGIGEIEAEEDDEDAKSIRDEKDKARWARLRRVKSLFDTKGNKRPPGKKA